MNGIRINYDLLFGEIKRKDLKWKMVATELGMTYTNLNGIKNSRTRELTGTQLAIVCNILGSPMDMFVTRKVENEG